jgi:hypothetical protein
MTCRYLLALLACVLAGVPAARAEPAPGWHFLPGVSRVVPLEETASRDAPVLELAFGPSGQLSLGQALALLTRRCARGPDFHLALSGLVALEDATREGFFPDELMRVVGTLGVAWTFGEETPIELGLEVGVERARELVGAESERVSLEPAPGDIPFGGGGLWLGADLGLRLPLASRWSLMLRVADRMYTNAWPLLFGLVAESQSVASYLDEGLTHAPSVALGVRWAASPEVQPVARLFLEGLLPHDDSADASWFLRALLGAALPGIHGELLPFLSLDVGSGKGLLVNRHELRFSVGVRHVLR